MDDISYALGQLAATTKANEKIAERQTVLLERMDERLKKMEDENIANKNKGYGILAALGIVCGAIGAKVSHPIDWIRHAIG